MGEEELELEVGEELEKQQDNGGRVEADRL